MVDRNPVRGRLIQYYADIHVHENAVATVIGTAGEPHLVQGLFDEQLASFGFIFEAGSTGAITAFADATGGQVTVTSAGHSMSTGDVVSISGTTNYNGIFIIANAQTDTFEITDTWVANDATGNFYKGDNLTVSPGSEGIYKIDFHTHGSSAAPNKNFEFRVYKNTTFSSNIHTGRFYATNDSGSTSGGGLIQLDIGDKLTYAIVGTDDTTNFTMEHCNMNVTKASDIP